MQKIKEKGEAIGTSPDSFHWKRSFNRKGYVQTELERVGKISSVSLAAEKKVAVLDGFDHATGVLRNQVKMV